MIEVDIKELENQLNQYKLEVERKLKYMVAGFAKEMTYLVSSNTPIGDAERLANDFGYNKLYEIRFKGDEETGKAGYGIEMDVGFHAGAWVYSQDSTPMFDPEIYPAEGTVDKAFQQAKDIYKLGQSFYIAATGPGYYDLERSSSPKAPMGIIAPTMQAVQGMYSIELAEYYKRG